MELVPHLTQCRLGRGLPPYQWQFNPSSCFVTIDMGRKLGSCAPFLGQLGWAEAYLHAKFHFDPSNRLATIHQRYRQTGQDNGP